jgi:hypothetical protein
MRAVRLRLRDRLKKRGDLADVLESRFRPSRAQRVDVAVTPGDRTELDKLGLRSVVIGRLIADVDASVTRPLGCRRGACATKTKAGE